MELTKEIEKLMFKDIDDLLSLNQYLLKQVLKD